MTSAIFFLGIMAQLVSSYGANNFQTWLDILFTGVTALFYDIKTENWKFILFDMAANFFETNF